MNIINQAISGQESKPDAASPYSALVNFYYSFNNQNIESMESNWLQTEEASMSNPLGGIKRGWGEIKGVCSKCGICSRKWHHTHMN